MRRSLEVALKTNVERVSNYRKIVLFDTDREEKRGLYC